MQIGNGEAENSARLQYAVRFHQKGISIATIKVFEHMARVDNCNGAARVGDVSPCVRKVDVVGSAIGKVGSLARI
jgi:hypothetical protein